jgi:hypothetical protein
MCVAGGQCRIGREVGFDEGSEEKEAQPGAGRGTATPKRETAFQLTFSKLDVSREPFDESLPASKRSESGE